MSDESPFFSQPLKKRRAPIKKSAINARKAMDEHVSTKLSSIYRDDKGNMPDMKRIKIKGGHSFVKGLVGIIVLGGFLAAAAWAGFFFLPATNKLDDSQVALTIDGPKNTTLGEINTYKITYENLKSINLKNVSLNIYYPDGFSFLESSSPSKNASHTEWNIGTIGEKQKGEITITGKTYGTLDKESSWRIFLNYQPENFNSAMQKITNFATKVTKSPLSINITGPDKAIVGSEIEYIFKFNDTQNIGVKEIELMPIMPANFHITSSTPIIKKNLWVINYETWKNPSSTLANQDLTFKIKGQYSQSDNARPEVKAVAYLFQAESEQKFEVSSASLNTELVKNNVGLNLAINGSLNDFNSQPGNNLNLTLNAKNNSDQTIIKASVKLILDSPSVKGQSILNWGSLTDKYDGAIKGEQISDSTRRGQIVWDYKKIPVLSDMKSNDEVNIDIGMPIKTEKDINLAAYKDFKVKATAEISYTDVTGNIQTVTSNPITITINSDLNFELRQTSTKENETENYQITWLLNNSFHPLKNILLSADVYGDITWKEPASVPAGQITFDPKTKKITWKIEQMPEGVDVLAVPLNIILNKRNPTQNTLVSKVKITAEDTITLQTIELTGDEILLQ